MEVLIVARQVRHRNILQQSLRRRVNLRNRVAGLQWRVAGEGRVCRRIENLYRFSRGECGLGEVSLPLQQRWHSRKLIKRIFRALAVVIDEIKSLGPAVVDVGNIKRPTHGTAETILQVCRFFRGLSGERKRRSVQSRISDSIIERSMGAIDVKAPPAKTSATKTTPTESSTSGTTPRTAKSASTTEPSSLLAGIVEALLQFVSAHRIERIGSVARDSYRLRSTVRRNPGNRHPGGHYIAYGAAGRILPTSTLKHRKALKTTSTCIRLLLFIGGLACPRRQNQFKIREHILMRRIQYHFLRTPCKRRHPHPHGIVPIRGNPQPVTAIHIRPRIDLLLRGRIRRGNVGTGNRHIPRLHHAVNSPASSRGSSDLPSSLPARRMRLKHEHMKQEEELEDELRAQLALDRQKTQKAKARIPH